MSDFEWYKCKFKENYNYLLNFYKEDIPGITNDTVMSEYGLWFS